MRAPARDHREDGRRAISGVAHEAADAPRCRRSAAAPPDRSGRERPAALPCGGPAPRDGDRPDRAGPPCAHARLRWRPPGRRSPPPCSRSTRRGRAGRSRTARPARARRRAKLRSASAGSSDASNDAVASIRNFSRRRCSRTPFRARWITPVVRTARTIPTQATAPKRRRHVFVGDRQQKRHERRERDHDVAPSGLKGGRVADRKEVDQRERAARAVRSGAQHGDQHDAPQVGGEREPQARALAAERDEQSRGDHHGVDADGGDRGRRPHVREQRGSARERPADDIQAGGGDGRRPDFASARRALGKPEPRPTA